MNDESSLNLTEMEKTREITEVREATRFEAVGHCIYCGSNSDLTDEHMIPFALAGNLILPDSSCRACAKITSDFERRVLRGFMEKARIAGDFPTRKPKRRPKSLTLQIGSDDGYENVELAPKDHPAILLLPLLEPPHFLTERPNGEGVTAVGYEAIYFGKHPSDVAKDLQVTNIRASENWDLTSFGRLLAKIAYGYAVGVYGTIPREDVFVLPLILGLSDDASVWLGSVEFALAIEVRNPTHALASAWVPDPKNPANEILVVRVKLFADAGATGYEIIVGQRNLS